MSEGYSEVQIPRISAPHLVRPRLRDVLDQGQPITVIRAPMGYGKTALVADWVAHLPDVRRASAAWVTVERDWNDPHLLWTEIARALTHLGFPTNSSGTVGPFELGRTLEAATEPVTLVLDAVDRLALSSVDVELVELVRRSPNLQLVACMRARSFDRSDWLDVDGHVIESADLAFTDDEVRELLEQFGLQLGEEELTQILDEGAGWPLALRTIGVAVTEQHGKLAAGLEIARSRLTKTVLSSVTEAKLDEIALPASVLPEFTAEDLDDVVAGHIGAAAAIALASEGLVAAVGHPGGALYRWPSMLRRIAYDEFVSRDAERVLELHRQLGQLWFERDTPLPALQHALASRDWELLVDVLTRMVGRLTQQHREETLGALAAIPASVAAHSVMVRALRAYLVALDDGSVLVDWNLPASTAELRVIAGSGNARSVLNTANVVCLVLRRQRNFAQCRAITLRASRLAEIWRTEFNGDGTSVATHLQCGITYLHIFDLTNAEHEFTIAFRHGGQPLATYVPRDAAGKLALMHALSGHVGRAETWLARSDAAPPPDPALREMIDGARAAARALIAVEQGNSNTALAVLPSLLDATQDDDFWLLSLHARAQVALLWDDATQALREVAGAPAMQRRQSAHPWIAALLLADEIDLNLALGNGGRARHLLQSQELTEASLVLARARMALYVGDNAGALEDARATPLAEYSTGWLQLHALVVEAVAARRLGMHDQASAATSAAVRRAVREGSYSAFATVPRTELLALLADVADVPTGVLELVNQLPVIFPDQLTDLALTPRERVILEYLAAGATLKAIASREIVSVNTVKSQSRTLYRKLGVTRREDALRVARAAGLLS